MSESEGYLDRDALLGIIAEFSRCQGFYGRLLRNLEAIRMADPDQYEYIMQEWEDQNFTCALDFIEYIEGRRPLFNIFHPIFLYRLRH